MRIRTATLWGLLVFLGVLMTACATPPAAFPTTAAMGEYPLRLPRGDVTVAVRPIVEGEESRKYFGVTLWRGELLAVLVVVENKSPSTRVWIDKEHCKATLGGVTTEAVAAYKVYGGTPKPKDVGEGSDERYALMANELCSQILLPGKTTQGFVYFTWPDAVQENGLTGTVQLPVRRLPDGPAELFEIKLSPATK
jgi:hypothetical protein